MDSQPLKQQSNFHRAPQIAYLSFTLNRSCCHFPWPLSYLKQLISWSSVYSVNSMYHYTRQGEIITNYSLWSNHGKHKQEQLPKHLINKVSHPPHQLHCRGEVTHPPPLFARGTSYMSLPPPHTSQHVGKWLRRRRGSTAILLSWQRGQHTEQIQAGKLCSKSISFLRHWIGCPHM